MLSLVIVYWVSSAFHNSIIFFLCYLPYPPCAPQTKGGGTQQWPVFIHWVTSLVMSLGWIMRGVVVNYVKLFTVTVICLCMVASLLYGKLWKSVSPWGLVRLNNFISYLFLGETWDVPAAMVQPRLTLMDCWWKGLFKQLLFGCRGVSTSVCSCVHMMIG